MTDLTKGSPLKVIIKFAVPVYVGQLFNLTYGIIDTRIVGSFLGKENLAAVGSVSTLTDFSVMLLIGFIMGFGIIISTFFGAKDEGKMKIAIAWTWVMGLTISLAYSLLSVFLLNPILKILNIGESLAPMAKSYSRIILLGQVASTAYVICSTILRSVGDSLTPLLFLIFSNVLNGILDYLFVSKTSMGISGAAIATVLSQIVSAITCFVYMRKKHPSIMVHRSDFFFEPHIIKELISSGFSMSIMASFVQFGTVALQTSINTLGANIIVGHVAARKIGSVCMSVFSCFGTTLATFCGQNLGAGLMNRIKKGIISSYFVCLGWWAITVIVIYNFAPLLITALTASTNEEVLKNGTMYLYINSSMYWVTAGISVLRNSMQGFGDRKTPLVSSFIELAAKLIIATFIAPNVGYFAIILSEPIIWCIMVIPLIVGTVKKIRLPFPA